MSLCPVPCVRVPRFCSKLHTGWRRSSARLSARESVAGRPTGRSTTARARAGSRRTMATTAMRS
eukprot:578749-Prymnesium_polylepis.1